MEAADARFHHVVERFREQWGAGQLLEKDLWEARRDVDDRDRTLAHQAQVHEERVSELQRVHEERVSELQRELESEYGDEGPAQVDWLFDVS